MKTNYDDQGSVWQAAFAEGLARGEAAFGSAHGSAISFAESFAFLIEAEQQKAAPEASPAPKKDDAKAGWAKAFNRLG